jgi:ketosteroid isomerase-like protein
MGNTISPANEALIQDYLTIATVTDDMGRFAQLLTDDCVWVMEPTGHAFTGAAQVAALARTAGGTRVHDDTYRVRVSNWFTDGENFCVEYQHAAIIKQLPIKGEITICLVCHMRNGKFDRIHEYVHARGAAFKVIMSVGLRILPLLVNRNLSRLPRVQGLIA